MVHFDLSVGPKMNNTYTIRATKKPTVSNTRVLLLLMEFWLYKDFLKVKSTIGLCIKSQELKRAFEMYVISYFWCFRAFVNLYHSLSSRSVERSLPYTSIVILHTEQRTESSDYGGQPLHSSQSRKPSTLRYQESELVSNKALEWRRNNGLILDSNLLWRLAINL